MASLDFPGAVTVKSFYSHVSWWLRSLIPLLGLVKADRYEGNNLDVSEAGFLAQS
jgi:hypothetical protein